jgi:phosphoglycolate phosphatase-like HAD superfamily hydrolase
VKPLLLFDVDGTLLLTGGAGMRAMRRVAEALFGGGFRWDGIEVSGHLDPLIFAEAAALNGLDVDSEHHEEFRTRYLDALREELERGRAGIRVMPGVHETLALLRERPDVTLGLLTGNYAEAIPVKLAAIGVDPGWFSISAFGDEGESRPALVLLALAKYSRLLGRPADPRRVIVIGDTPRDVHCAHANRCIAFGVATGSYSVADLRAAGADEAVTDLSDPTPLVALVERLSDIR